MSADPFGDADWFPIESRTDLPFFRPEIAYDVEGRTGVETFHATTCVTEAWDRLDQILAEGDPACRRGRGRFGPQHITGARVLRFQPMVRTTVEPRPVLCGTEGCEDRGQPLADAEGRTCPECGVSPQRLSP